VNDFVNAMSGSIVEQPIQQEEFVSEQYTEPSNKLTIISEGTKKPIGSGKRGRPKKK
jgi:hypothetical protein